MASPWHLPLGILDCGPSSWCQKATVARRTPQCALGAELVEHGDDFHAADAHADELARPPRLHRILSFHPLLVQGVASDALELFTSVESIDVVYVSFGWGSGAGGLAAVRNALGLRTKIVGVVSQEAPCYSRSFAQGVLVEVTAKTRIADGIATSHL